ncbi:BUD13 homolog isoform X1 [Heterodontus francisci]|uniref:BUD13 homolog isoform X1 n=1 Tax=Heterodontus francisci TaxID=7792 RepID=UPI00355AD753
MAALSKEEYLRRYLSGPDLDPAAGPGPSRRRRKKVKIKTGGMRIVDDDVTWKSLAKEKEAVLEAVESDEDDEAPVVAEFFDERPEVIQQMEVFRLSNKWKILGDEKEDARESELFLQKRTEGLLPGSESAQRKRIDTDPQLTERKIRTVSPDLSPPRRGRHDSPDLSPPRRSCHDSPDLSPPKRGRHDSPDLSPPRRGRQDSPDLSPPRRGRHDSPDLSPPRRGRHDSPDLSPPRRGCQVSPDLSPARRGSSDLSPPRKKLPTNTEKRVRSTDLPSRKTLYNSPDLSPTRNKQRDYSDSSLPSNTRYCSDSDLSPPRKRQSSSLEYQSAVARKRTNAQGLSPIKQKDRRATGSPGRRQDPDSELSPPRKVCQHSSDSDLSPPRRKRLEVHDSEYRPNSGTSEPSPTRHRLLSRKPTPSRGRGASRDSSPSRKSQGNEMLSGGQAGLVSTDILRKEKEDRRKRERAAERLADDSKNATTVFRDKSGKKRDLDQERIERKKKEEEKAAKQEKYAQWGKGRSSGERTSRMRFMKCKNRSLDTSMMKTWIASCVRKSGMEIPWLD